MTAGAKQAVFNACQALFDEGDEVALFSPYWVSFPEIVRLAGARAARSSRRASKAGGTRTAGALARAATPATRGVILNSPNNPTGAVTPAGEIERILGWCADRGAWLVFDETYDRFLYDGRAARVGRGLPGAPRPGHRDRRGVEDLRDDGLAARLGDRAARTSSPR